MKKYRIFAAMVLGLTLSSCGAAPQQVEGKTARQYAESLTYTQESRTGLCFGVVGSSETKVGRPAESRDTMILVNVPCAPVQRFLTD